MHIGKQENEEPNKLERIGATMAFIEPEPFCCMVRKGKELLSRDQRKKSQNPPGNIPKIKGRHSSKIYVLSRRQNSLTKIGNCKICSSSANNPMQAEKAHHEYHDLNRRNYMQILSDRRGNPIKCFYKTTF